MNDIRAIEREFRRLAYSHLLANDERRLPLKMVLALPAIAAQIHHADEIPDDLIRILTELREDGYLRINDMRIDYTLDGSGHVSIYGNYPSFSLTKEGRQWVTQRVGENRVEARGDSGRDGLLVYPSAFNTPQDKKHSEPNLLVAVMMPFKKEFEGVYETIESVCGKLGMTARKADDMWKDQVIIQDIFTLLYLADIVVVDFSGSNPNVMYETGVAHTLGKEVIPLAQNIESDVPFDMRHHRVLPYVANKQGLEELAEKLLNKLQQYS